VVQVTRYQRPYPQVTSRATEAGCQAVAPGDRPFLCTREHEHDGDHEAGVPNGRKAASWPQEATDG
jgi:hypothetical protein